MSFSVLQEGGESVASQYIVDIQGGAHGQLGAGHLGDHPSAVSALQGALKVGSPLGPLLVLERVEVRPALNVLSDVSTWSFVCKFGMSIWGDALLHFIRLLIRLYRLQQLPSLTDDFNTPR